MKLIKSLRPSLMTTNEIWHLYPDFSFRLFAIAKLSSPSPIPEAKPWLTPGRSEYVWGAGLWLIVETWRFAYRTDVVKNNFPEI